MALTAAVSRARLAGLLNLMQGARTGLRRDECGDPRLIGRHGHLYVNGQGFLLFLAFTDRPRAWTFARAVPCLAGRRGRGLHSDRRSDGPRSQNNP